MKLLKCIHTSEVQSRTLSYLVIVCIVPVPVIGNCVMGGRAARGGWQHKFVFQQLHLRCGPAGKKQQVRRADHVLTCLKLVLASPPWRTPPKIALHRLNVFVKLLMRGNYARHIRTILVFPKRRGVDLIFSWLRIDVDVSRLPLPLSSDSRPSATPGRIIFYTTEIDTPPPIDICSI